MSEEIIEDMLEEVAPQVAGDYPEIAQRYKAGEELTDEELDTIADVAISILRSILSHFDAANSPIDEYEATGNNAAGRDGEVTSADTDAIGVVEDTQCLENLVVVGKRLALAHEDNACGTLAKVVGYMKHLVDDLLSGQRALEAVETGQCLT